MKQTINWKKYYLDCFPIEDNYRNRDVLCKWEDGSITTENVKYERIHGDPERKYEGYLDSMFKPIYWAEIE